MGVDVIDVLRLQAGVLQRHVHAGAALAASGRTGSSAVAIGAVAGQHRKRLGAARQRDVLGLEHEHGRALAEHHAIAVLGEGPAEIRRQHPQDSQARMAPLVAQASEPPTMARSIMPARIICMARPIAWLPEEQALATAKQGPVAPERTEICEGPALGMRRGTVSASGRLLAK